MSTALTWQTESTSLEDTLAIAARLGSKLGGGEIIELVGDLGSGKTAFVRGLAQGLGSTDVVRSPSFTLSNQYSADSLTLYHFDFYRLDEAGIMREEIGELFDDPQAVVVVEWPEVIEDVLPVKRLELAIRVTGESSRQFTFRYPQNLRYLMPANR